MTLVQNTINGIQLQSVQQLVDDITGHPANGLATFKAKTRWTGGTKSETKISGWELGGKALPRDFTIKTDEPHELAGEGLAPNPQEVLQAAINACMMVGYVALCSIKGIELESLEISSEGTLDLRGFLGLDDSVNPGYNDLHYTVRIKGNGTREQFEEIHELVRKTSPNYSNASKPIRMNPTLVVD
jgi:uncharacterized OsmC-like protein